MKKQYVKPACEVIMMAPCASILAGSADQVKVMDNTTQVDLATIENDESEDDMWAGAKGHGSIWDD